MVGLKIFLLGPPRVERDGSPVDINRRKTLAMLIYLVVSGQPHSRDALATLFYPDYDQSRARAYFRRDLALLKTSLPDDWLAADRDTVELDHGNELWLDVERFRHNLIACQSHDHAPELACTDCLPLLTEAVNLYHNDFLAGFTLRDCPEFDDWQFFQAESLRQDMTSALKRLVRGYSAQEDYETAIPYARRRLTLDPLHEPAHRDLMRLYWQSDQQAAALRQYEECVRILDEEFGVSPEQETTTLYEAIKAKRLVDPLLQAKAQHRSDSKDAEAKHSAERSDPPPKTPTSLTSVVTDIGPHDRYLAEERLATGGQGDVYRGLDRLTGRAVVIKRLKPEAVTGDTDAVSRFERESVALRQLNHPNIVAMLATFERDGQHNIVMEYVPGGSLRDRLEVENRLPPEQVLDIALELADALSRAHHLRIIHRDLKPGNVLLAADGTPRLTDFGIARLEREDARLTKTGEILGSPAYMSPEALRGKELDPSSDVWSFGILLYELLAGQRPFEGKRITQVMSKILEKPVPDIRQVQPDVPLSLVDLLQRILVKDRKNRIASMRQVAAELEAIRSGKVIDVQPPPPLLTGERQTFVARQQELARLDALLDTALAGQAQVVFIIGEAGQGKTVLLQAFAQRAQEKNPNLIVAGGNCNAYTGSGDPYLPFREILELLTGDLEARAVTGTIQPDHTRRLQQMIPITIQALVETAPDLLNRFVPVRQLLNRAIAIASPEADWLADLQKLGTQQTEVDTTGVQQSALFEQYAKVLRRVAQQTPVLLFLDDLQWIDAGSAGLLLHLGRRLADLPILIVGTYRPAEVALGRPSSSSGEPERHPLQQVINEFQRQFGDILLDLSQAEGEAFVEALLDTEPNRLDANFRQTFFRQTRGHPLFSVELLRGMQERGDLVQDEAGRWVAQPELDWQTLPARVEGAIGERISRLDAPLRELLQVASVEGEEFTAELVAQVLGTDERMVIRQLGRELAKKHHLVRALGLKQEGGLRLSRYRFRHILIQRYLYHSLDEVEQIHLNEATGNVLERLYSEQTESVAGQLARHFQEAGLQEKAVGYLLQAGRRANRLSAHEEAIAHLQQGLALLEALPDTDERARSELELQIALGNALIATKGYAAPEVEITYSRARELIQNIGEITQLPPVLYGLYAFYVVRGTDVHKARELGQEILSLAQSPQDPILLVAHRSLGIASFFIGQLPSARNHFEQIMALHDPEAHRYLAFTYGQDPGVAGPTFLASTLWLLGYPDHGLKHSHEAITLAQQVSHPLSLAYALYNGVCVIHQFRREAQLVQKHAETLIALCNEHGLTLYRALGLTLRGWTLIEQGQIEEGIDQIRRGHADFQATGAGMYRPHLLSLLAEAYAKAGQIREGLSVVADVLAMIEATDQRFWEAEVYRVKGMLLLGQSSVEAEICFRQAIEVARRQSAKSLELRGVMSLTRLLREQGRADEARPMLAEIHGWFSEGFDTPDLQEAKVLLTELERDKT